MMWRSPHGQNGASRCREDGGNRNCGASPPVSTVYERSAWNLNNDCWIELLTSCGHPPPYYRVRDGAGPAGIEIYCLACATNLKTSIEAASPQRSDR